MPTKAGVACSLDEFVGTECDTGHVRYWPKADMRELRFASSAPILVDDDRQLERPPRGRIRRLHPDPHGHI